MKNELGICSWTLGITDLAALMQKTQDLGLDGVQFSGDQRQYDPTQLRQGAAAHGLTLFAIDPFDCAPPDPQAASTAGAVAYYQAVIDFAVAAGAPWVTVHGLTQWTKNCASENEAWARLVDCGRQLARYAAPLGIRLVFEAVNRYETPRIRDAATARRLLADIGADIGLILDSFHMALEETDSCAAIRTSAGQLASYHISDSNRLGIGSGQVNFLAQHRTLSDLSFAGPVMVELVLPHLAPTTPPQTAADWQGLDAEIRRTARCWRALE